MGMPEEEKRTINKWTLLIVANFYYYVFTESILVSEWSSVIDGFGLRDRTYSTVNHILYCKKKKKKEIFWPGQVFYVHQHGVLLHVKLVSQDQQLHKLLV